jgi:hypothetical protein
MRRPPGHWSLRPEPVKATAQTTPLLVQKKSWNRAFREGFFDDPASTLRSAHERMQ